MKKGKNDRRGEMKSEKRKEKNELKSKNWYF